MNKKTMYVGIREDMSNKLTIVAEVVDNNELKVAVSVCNPKDVFKKAFGRQVAMARLKKEGKYFVTKFTGHSEDDVARLFASELDSNVKEAYLGFKWSKRGLMSVGGKLIAFENS